jgi:carotenoid cleavage dioxygenase-like enzyme
VKKDLCNENNDKYWFVENHYSVEAWFVPSPNKNSEDDGILVVPVLTVNIAIFFASVIFVYGRQV